MKGFINDLFNYEIYWGSDTDNRLPILDGGRSDVYRFSYSMNIFYDHQAFTFQKYGGVSRYFIGLTNELRRLEHTVDIGCFLSDNYYLNELEKRKSLPKWLKGRTTLSYLLNSVLYLRNSYDIYHPTYYYPQCGKKGKRLVVTVHDMAHEKLPGHFSSKDNTSSYKKKIVNRADRIIAISENTKKDLIEILSVPKEKIDVVYHCSYLKEGVAQEVKLPEKYILFVGQRYSYKNFNLFVKAIRPLLLKDKDLFLVLAGGGALSKIEMSSLVGIQDRVIQNTFSDQQLISVYARALCLVFPSLFEGFGLPILEAFQCGCPVVLSNASCFPEIAKDAGIYFDPYSMESMEDTISRVINNSPLRDHLRMLGKKRMKNFSQEKVARQTLETYQKVL